MDPPIGSIVSYATAPGDVAADGNGRNSTYAKHLLAHIRQADLTVQDVFRKTGLAVMQQTGRRQVPWTLTPRKD